MGLHVSDAKVQHCMSAAEVVALARAVRTRKRERYRPPQRSTPINDLTPVSFPVPVQMAEPIQRRIEPPKVGEIIDLVCETYGQTRTDVLSDRRDKHCVRARQIACYLAATMTPRSFPAIGRVFFRDHTTILHARDKIKKMREASPAVDAELSALEQQIGGRRYEKNVRSVWGIYPEMDERLRDLVEKSGMRYKMVALKLSREFDCEVTDDMVNSRVSVLGVMSAQRRKLAA